MADNDQTGKKEKPKAPEELADVKRTGGGGGSGGGGGGSVGITSLPTDPPVNVNIKSQNPVDVNLHGTPASDRDVQGLWEYIRQATDAISFRNYTSYIDRVLCDAAEPTEDMTSAGARLRRHFLGIDGYQLLRMATEAFLLVRTGMLTSTTPFASESDSDRFGGLKFDKAALTQKLGRYLGTDVPKALPYIDSIIDGLVTHEATSGSQKLPFYCDDIDRKVLEPLFIDLFWVYWQEHAGVMQAINGISLRFQNKRIPGDHDPLAGFTAHPLRPLSNLLWGFIQDDDHRLTVARRAFEYDSQFGLALVGRAVPAVMRTADSRSNFLEAFHTLLHQAAIYYDRSANLTIQADAFALVNVLNEVHLILAEGAHNQFRELTYQARVETLIAQWMLGRREVRDFLGGRPAVPYAEEWMRTVDVLRKVVGWGDVPVTHFNDLAIAGEKILLSIRYGNWSDTSNITEADARSWAIFFRPEIQRYIHAYNAVTGIDLSAATQVTSRRIDATQPAILLQQRSARQRAR